MTFAKREEEVMCLVVILRTSGMINNDFVIPSYFSTKKGVGVGELYDAGGPGKGADIGGFSTPISEVKTTSFL